MNFCDKFLDCYLLSSSDLKEDAICDCLALANFNVKNEVTDLGDSWSLCVGSFWEVKKWHIVEKDVGRIF